MISQLLDCEPLELMAKTVHQSHFSRLDSVLIPLAEQWKPPPTFLNDAD